MGLGSASGQFWPIAIDSPTRPKNIASTAVQQVMKRSFVWRVARMFQSVF
jgi:hypothetical protein